MMLTVDYDMTRSTPDHLCFKAEASNSGGNHSPKMDWTPPPAGTKSLVLMMEDQEPPPIPHRIVCNMMPTETGQAADIGTKVPAGAMVGTGHNKPGNPWYGPGADVHEYQITIFALATPTLEGGCGPDGAHAKAARDYLKKNKDNKAIVLDYDTKTLWGDKTGTKCK